MRQSQLPVTARRGVHLRAHVVLLVAVAASPLARATATEPEATTGVAAQGDAYAIDRHTVDAGGGTSSGGAFEIQGSIGQPDADPLQPSTGGVFDVTGGFWPGLAPAPPQPDALFANGFE